jgi:hypothetical protein
VALSGELMWRKMTVRRTPLPGFGRQCPRQELGVEKVHGVEALLMARTVGTEPARRWLSTVSSAVAHVQEQRRAERCEGGRERGGNPPLRRRGRIRSTPAWAAATTNGDWRLRSHRREHGHHAVTGLVASGTGPVTGASG